VLSKIITRFIVLLVVAGIGWLYWTSRPLRHPPGVLVPNPPVQTAVRPKVLGRFAGWTVTAVAEYHLRGRVLASKRYYTGEQAGLVPVDVAVGWGRMSDQEVLDRLKVSMGNRFYFYEWSNEPPIPQDEIVCSSANNHVIPANDAVRKTIGGLRTGQILTLHGYLVNASGPEGRTWISSLTRTDTGNGACELFYVEKAQAADSLADEF
jgi:hypothetical protein